MVFRKNNGLTMIELLIVLAILSAFILVAIFAYLGQLAKGRDAKRKADLDKLQNVLEDYLNDKICYPDGLVCGTDFAPYLSQVPCDPINNIYYNYFYSYDGRPEVVCKSWYKIYTKLENTKDPIIEKVGCANGCGPSNNYNYWVSSPNVTKVTQLPGEWWPDIPGVTPPVGGTPTSPPVASPTPSPTPGASPTPTSSPTPTPTPATPTPTPTPGGNYYGCFSGVCTLLWGYEQCQPNYLNYPNCDPGGVNLCGSPQNPQNECK